MKACYEGAVSQVKELVAEGTKKPGWINSHNDVNDKKQEGVQEEPVCSLLLWLWGVRNVKRRFISDVCRETRKSVQFSSIRGLRLRLLIALVMQSHMIRGPVTR